LKSFGSSCCGRWPAFGITFTVAFSPSFLHTRVQSRIQISATYSFHHISHVLSSMFY
jgi:hypothetical protein